MSKRLIAVIFAIFMTVILGAGCGSQTTMQEEAAAKKIKITDLAGREVEVPAPAQRIAAIGPGSLRLVCYVDGADKVVGVENIEQKDPGSRPYILAHPQLQNLPSIGQGGPDTAPDSEKLVSVKPDVIFVTYQADKAEADDLQLKTNIPVVVLSYGKLATFDQSVYQSMEIIGKVTGNEKRASDVVNYLAECQRDLKDRTEDIPDDQKPKVYVGALGSKGTHGIESTQGKYPPFVSVNARNVVDETGKEGSLFIDKEKLIDWDPDIIFIDEGGYNLVLDDYKKNPQLYQSLSAVKRGEVYAQIPYNYYTTNLGTAIADSYYAGKVIYPDRFKDVDPAQKADEIYSFLLGKPLYNQVAQAYGGFKKLSFE